MRAAFDGLVDARQLMRKIREANHPADSSIDAIYVEKNGPPRFMRNLNDKALDRVLARPGNPILRIFFLNVDGDAVSGKQFSAHALKTLNRKAGMSKLLLSQMYQDSEWVGRFGNGCFVNKGWSDTDTSFEMVYYHCEPQFDHMLINMVSTGSHTTYFIVNPTPNLYSRLRGQLETSTEVASRLFFPDILIADEVLTGFNDAAAEKWEELAVLEHETNTLPPSQVKPRVEELSLDWICLSQGLTSTSKQLSFLLQSYSRFFQTFSAPPTPMDMDDDGDMDVCAVEDDDDGGFVNSVLIGLDGREEEEEEEKKDGKVGIYTRGADDLLAFLSSKCQAQADWIVTSRESTRLVLESVGCSG